MNDDVERVARAVMIARSGQCLVSDWQEERRDNPNVEEAWNIATAAMRETREIDAEAAMKAGHRAVMANARLGAWMSAALDDPAVSHAMKADIQEWFSAGEPVNERLASLIADWLTGRADADA